MKSVLPERNTLHPSRTDEIEHRTLPSAAAAAVRMLAREIAVTPAAGRAESARTLADPELIALIAARGRELPAEVRTALRPPETEAGACVLHRLPISDDEIGPTPMDWRAAAERAGDRSGPNVSFELDIAMLLLAAAAGEPFGWAGQQNGRLVNNIVPAPGHELEQSGASSSILLSPHTEDAFHPQRANLLLLGCLRNPDRVGTTVSSVHRVELDARDRALLGSPALPILPDVSYGSEYDRATAIPVTTIWTGDETDGAAAHPVLRYDPAYTPLDDAEPDYRLAYARLEHELQRVCVLAALEPGELLLVDNDVAVHGRVPFTARYDGTDRWLKRVNIRLPERRRSAGEDRENGYGQRIVAPFGRAERNGAADDRGSVEPT